MFEWIIALISPYLEKCPEAWLGFLDHPAPDPRKLIKILDLEPETRDFICCPTCFACYPLDTQLRRCTFQATPNSAVCDARLFKSDDKRQPVKKYMHQDMSHWMARLLARPGIEDILDRPLSAPAAKDPISMRDIWHATELKSFKGPDGETFFQSNPASEARYALSMNVDGFDPAGGTHGGRHASVTAMYMVCLNLPPSERYKLENVYLVGIIP
ncbi:hypothetical protein SISNIDRAFT_419735, partial [Sistotremastrum niveocremeum HHB9708]